jgi:hypothetical protein
VLVDEPMQAKVLVPSVANGGSTLGAAWRGAAATEPFNDSAWLVNANGLGIGFDVNPTPQNYLPLVNNASLAATLRAQMQNVKASAFIRIPFEIAKSRGGRAIGWAPTRPTIDKNPSAFGKASPVRAVLPFGNDLRNH